MGKLEDYRACMAEKMKGKKFPKGERKKAFCAQAKICTGKAKNMDEAVKLCKEAHPDW